VSAAGEFRPPGPSRQLAFHQLLVAARANILHEALLSSLAEIDPDELAADLKACAPVEGRQLLAKAGIRDELVFVTPAVLRNRPTLFGYYRLLLGISQKAFYRTDTGFSRFKALEHRNQLAPWHDDRLPEACRAMNDALGRLIVQISPEVTRQDIDQLPLLTLGSQFQGSNNTSIGKQATEDVFIAIGEILRSSVVGEDQRSLSIVNASGRKVRVMLAADPDVAIEENFDGEWRLKVALEIKGGTDSSNAHNRAGEAEKSHQKVRSKARDFWTLIAMKGVNPEQLRLESPTSKEWFDISQVLGRSGPDWTRFRSLLVDVVGVPDND
jgi:hypothetical protein